MQDEPRKPSEADAQPEAGSPEPLASEPGTGEKPSEADAQPDGPAPDAADRGG